MNMIIDYSLSHPDKLIIDYGLFHPDKLKGTKLCAEETWTWRQASLSRQTFRRTIRFFYWWLSGGEYDDDDDYGDDDDNDDDDDDDDGVDDGDEPAWVAKLSREL